MERSEPPRDIVRVHAEISVRAVFGLRAGFSLSSMTRLESRAQSGPTAAELLVCVHTLNTLLDFRAGRHTVSRFVRD